MSCSDRELRSAILSNFDQDFGTFPALQILKHNKCSNVRENNFDSNFE